MNDKTFIHEHDGWTEWQWQDAALLPLLGRVRLLQGQLLGKLSAMGFELNVEAQLDAVCLEVIKTSEIEGEELNTQQVRSSVARHLGIDHLGIADVTPSREVDGVVEMMLDATHDLDAALTMDKLFAWHHALFPRGRSGMLEIQVGQLRDDANGPMLVVSGAYGKQTVHFQAPDAERLPDEMERFLHWLNDTEPQQPQKLKSQQKPEQKPQNNQELDLVLKAGIAHLWFVTLHPFDDGNGRLTRAITERVLAQSDNSSQRFYSLSAEMLKQRKAYYDILESTQKSSSDITAWLLWFLQALENALLSAHSTTEKILAKAQFWQKHSQQALNERQAKMLNKLLTDFYGKLTSKKWASMMQCSPDTALRDINDLIEKGMLKKSNASGRSTSYELVLS